MEIHDDGFISFDSWEELSGWLRSNEEQANRILDPVQRAITYGDHFVRFFDVARRLVIFAQCQTLEELLQSELHGGADIEEAASIVDGISNAHERGHLYGMHYSTIEPTGEWGSTHRLNAWPIGRDLYTAAARAGWNIDMLPDRSRRDLQFVYSAMRNHASRLFTHSHIN